ncbi:MAG: LuxR C-terminal-related transcriptional regulator [Dehalococcoidia bacterium]
MTTRARGMPAIAVWSRSPAVRAGLRDLLDHAGFEAISELGAGAPLPEVDVLVLDAPAGIDARVPELLAEATAEDRGVVLLVDNLPLTTLGGDGPPTPARAWLRREASEEELAAAVVAVDAGLTVVDPSLDRRSAGPEDGPVLTAREREVLALVALGMTNRAIALRLGISEHTAKFHVGALLAKLEVQSRAEAVSVAARLGVLSL